MSRRGLTLVEVIVSMALIGIVAAVTVPAFAGLAGTDRDAATAEPVARLLRSARMTALREARVTTVVIEPVSGRYTIAVAGEGMPRRTEGLLALGDGARILVAGPRARFAFEPSGPARSEPIAVRGPGGDVAVRVDPWTGDVLVGAR